MHHRRFFHEALVLNNGKVLVTVGSIDMSTNINSTELYDPTTGNWINAGNILMEL
jgi:hypothetical protein